VREGVLQGSVKSAASGSHISEARYETPADSGEPAPAVPDHGACHHLTGSGTGAWEAAIVNTLSPGDRVLIFETRHFSNL
jgi:aspartate aminotransferase-like enzyme